ncbi:helix-turn-helix transcriptional regulator [Paenibacillus glufosinatiresistens]|uniref:helix-turn-helix transcriptional regulator n=1 Tax=Paenibacillus glufosinatiresistens TaxID=3070657 RepID=UPI00286D81C0|nr:YafY family protein [Paenibacillus sp. YX.27]
MSKSKRLLELMLTVNRKRKFTVKELAREFRVSPRTMMRDLQELEELGVPLYSEVGAHGGYRVLNERILPPIAFTEEEAVSLFFASHALRHYTAVPFRAEASSALGKFYHYMSADVRERIDQMRNRVDFVIPPRQAEAPHLPLLLKAAISSKVLRIGYRSSGHTAERDIQPIGIYANSGLWYCPAYCFLRQGVRLFRCDRIETAREVEDGPVSLDLRETHLGNWHEVSGGEGALLRCRAELTEEGVRVCQAELGARGGVTVRQDGSGLLDSEIPGSELDYFARLFAGLGPSALVKEPPELIAAVRRLLLETLERYKK